MSLSPKLSLEKSNIVFESMFVATLEEYVIACALVLVEGNKEDQEHLEDIHPLLNEYNDVGQKRSLHVYLWCAIFNIVLTIFLVQLHDGVVVSKIDLQDVIIKFICNFEMNGRLLLRPETYCRNGWSCHLISLIPLISSCDWWIKYFVLSLMNQVLRE